MRAHLPFHVCMYVLRVCFVTAPSASFPYPAQYAAPDATKPAAEDPTEENFPYPAEYAAPKPTKAPEPEAAAPGNRNQAVPYLDAIGT